MSGFLLDTNVVSMLAPSKSEASADFLTWLDRKDADGRLFLSVVSYASDSDRIVCVM